MAWGIGCRVQGGLEFRVQGAYRGTSPIRNSADLGPYSRAIPRALWWSQGGGLFLMSEVPLYALRPGDEPSGSPTQGSGFRGFPKPFLGCRVQGGLGCRVQMSCGPTINPRSVASAPPT